MTQLAIERPQTADPFAEGLTERWFLLRTRSRQEKIIAHDLDARGILHFLPLERA